MQCLMSALILLVPCIMAYHNLLGTLHKSGSRFSSQLTGGGDTAQLVCRRRDMLLQYSWRRIQQDKQASVKQTHTHPGITHECTASCCLLMNYPNLPVGHAPVTAKSRNTSPLFVTCNIGKSLCITELLMAEGSMRSSAR